MFLNSLKKRSLNKCIKSTQSIRKDTKKGVGAEVEAEKKIRTDPNPDEFQYRLGIPIGRSRTLLTMPIGRSKTQLRNQFSMID